MEPHRSRQLQPRMQQHPTTAAASQQWCARFPATQRVVLLMPLALLLLMLVPLLAISCWQGVVQMSKPRALRLVSTMTWHPQQPEQGAVPADNTSPLDSTTPTSEEATSQAPASEEDSGSELEAVREQYGLYVGVLSASGNFEARQAIRQTWGADPRLLRVVFFILRPESHKAWMQLQDEVVHFGDIHVVTEVLEDYHKITHSTLALIKAAAAWGPQVKLVMKADDDNYVRVPLLLEALKDAPREWLYAGYPLSDTKIPRPPEDWGIPYETWPSDAPVKYAWGGASYVLSVDLARRIAAGGAHTVMEPDNLVEWEDIAVGLWVQAIEKMHDATVNYHYYSWSYYSCDDETVTVMNSTDRAGHVRCMHARGGRCCGH